MLGDDLRCEILHCLDGKEIHSDGIRSVQKWCPKVRYAFGANSQPQERSRIVIPIGFIAHHTPTVTYCNENARIDSGHLFKGSAALVRLSLLIVEVSRSYSDTPLSVEHLRTSDQLVADTSTWQSTTLKKIWASMTPAGFEPEILASERQQNHASGLEVSGIGQHHCRPKPEMLS